MFSIECYQPSKTEGVKIIVFENGCGAIIESHVQDS